MLFNVKNKWTIKPWKDTEETWGYTIEWKNLIEKAAIWQSRKGKTIETIKRSVVARVGRERWKGRTQRITSALKILHVIIVMMDLLTDFSKHIECTTPRKGKLRTFELLWYVTVGSSFKRKSTTLVSDIENEGDCACVGPRSIWKISMSPSQFCCKPKNAQKVKCFNNSIHHFLKWRIGFWILLHYSSAQTMNLAIQLWEGHMWIRAILIMNLKFNSLDIIIPALFLGISLGKKSIQRTGRFISEIEKHRRNFIVA